MRLEGKVALISGGARGQGAYEAKLFAEEGAAVVIGDVLHEQGAVVADEVSRAGGRALFVKLDVSREDEWKHALERAVQEFGKLNVLVNNASIYRTSPVEQTSAAEWDELMAVNSRGAFLGTKHAIPAMREAGGGSIVNISSVTGLVGSGRGGAYGASKAAVRLLTKHTAIQHARDGIRANSISPGSVDTQMIAANIGNPGRKGGFYQQDSAGPDRHRSGRCLRCAFPGFGRVVFHDGGRPGNRRRDDRAVGPWPLTDGPLPALWGSRVAERGVQSRA